MTQMTPDQEAKWLADYRQMRCEEQALTRKVLAVWHRAEIRLLFNRGVTRLKVRVRGRL